MCHGSTVGAISKAEKPFVAAVEAIYDAAPDPSRWPHALQAIANCFADVGAILIWQRDDGGFGTIVSPTLVAAQRDYDENQWNHRDLPAIRAVERSLWVRNDAVTDRHAVSDEEMASHPFYTQFLARHGLRWRASIGVAPDPHVVVAISVQRAIDRSPYSDAELEAAAWLGRHVEKALRLSIRLFDAETTGSGLAEALARLGIGVFVLDGVGRIVLSNPAGEQMVGDGLVVRNQRLTAWFEADRSILRKAIEAMLRAHAEDLVTDARPILIQRSKSARPLTAYVLPVLRSQRETKDSFLVRARAIVLVIDPKGGEPADPSVVRDLLGVTLGEGRVAALVGYGLSPREAAAKLGISEETARTTLKRVFSKVGVSRQSELVALLTKLVLR